jgi:hypothetical protein
MLSNSGKREDTAAGTDQVIRKGRRYTDEVRVHFAIDPADDTPGVAADLAPFGFACKSANAFQLHTARPLEAGKFASQSSNRECGSERCSVEIPRCDKHSRGTSEEN